MHVVVILIVLEVPLVAAARGPRVLEGHLARILRSAGSAPRLDVEGVWVPLADERMSGLLKKTVGKDRRVVYSTPMLPLRPSGGVVGKIYLPFYFT